MALSLRQDDETNSKVRSAIAAMAKEKTSRAAPKGTRTFLLYIPNEVHVEAKMHAIASSVTLHDYIVDAIRRKLKTA